MKTAKHYRNRSGQVIFKEVERRKKKKLKANPGRAWKAKELRQKSFEDLHKLWYVLLKERNLLATQKHEANRLNIPSQVWSNQGRMKKCQKSMARIKCVLYERQREYEKLMAEQAAKQL